MGVCCVIANNRINLGLCLWVRHSIGNITHTFIDVNVFVYCVSISLRALIVIIEFM